MLVHLFSKMTHKLLVPLRGSFVVVTGGGMTTGHYIKQGPGAVAILLDKRERQFCSFTLSFDRFEICNVLAFFYVPLRSFLTA